MTSSDLLLFICVLDDAAIAVAGVRWIKMHMRLLLHWIETRWEASREDRGQNRALCM